MRHARSPANGSLFHSPTRSLVKPSLAVIALVVFGTAPLTAGPASGQGTPGSSSVTATPATLPGGRATATPTTATSPPPRQLKPAPLPAPLRVDAPVPPRAVVALTMFSPTSGVAVAHVPPPSFGRAPSRPQTGRSYLVHTLDGGLGWRVTGPLPAALTPTPTSYDQLAMAFRSPTEGYVTLAGYSDRTFFTLNGGRSWSRVSVTGSVGGLGYNDGLSLIGDKLWMTSSRCRRVSAESRCSADLITVAVGRLTPTTIRPIPAPSTTSFAGEAAAVLLGRPAEDEGLFVEEGSPSTILETADAGASWIRVQDPCQSVGIAGLVSPTPERWILYCSRDMGMHQGSNQLWVTTDAGQHWVLTAEGGYNIPAIGNVGGEIAGEFAISGNGQILWLLGGVGGISYSTDGGSDWQQTRLNTGGYLASFATVGGSEAWYPVPGTGLFRTLNGMIWTRLK